MCNHDLGLGLILHGTGPDRKALVGKRVIRFDHVVIITQTVEYRIRKGVSGLVKTVSHPAIEWSGPTVHRQSAKSLVDLDDALRVPVTPPTTTSICDPIDITYALQVRQLLFTDLSSYSGFRSVTIILLLYVSVQ